MNIFQNFSDFLGKNESEEFISKYNEFLTAARSVRKQLGKQAHILDKYLYDAFAVFSEVTANNVADDGYEAASELRGIITDILTIGNKTTKHPYHQTAKTYIEEHPLPLFNETIKNTVYLSALSEDFFPQSISLFINKRLEVICEELGSDKSDFDMIYESICSALEGSSQMDNLNRFMCECFMMPSAVSVYTQGYWGSICTSFISLESGRSAIQLLLETEL